MTIYKCYTFLSTIIFEIVILLLILLYLTSQSSHLIVRFVVVTYGFGIQL